MVMELPPDDSGLSFPTPSEFCHVWAEDRQWGGTAPGFWLEVRCYSAFP